MPRQALDWLITDSHFYHDFMIEACGRPANFTALIISNCRKVIAVQDRVWHLGDVQLRRLPEMEGLLRQIPGTKFLCMGNHDYRNKGPSWYMKRGFACAADMFVVHEDILLSHKPMPELPSWVRLNIHGHWHNDNHHERPEWYSSRHRLLSIEEQDYKPVRLIDFAKEGGL